MPFVMVEGSVKHHVRDSYGRVQDVTVTNPNGRLRKKDHLVFFCLSDKQLGIGEGTGKCNLRFKLAVLYWAEIATGRKDVLGSIGHEQRHVKALHGLLEGDVAELAKTEKKYANPDECMKKGWLFYQLSERRRKNYWESQMDMNFHYKHTNRNPDHTPIPREGYDPEGSHTFFGIKMIRDEAYAIGAGRWHNKDGKEKFEKAARKFISSY